MTPFWFVERVPAFTLAADVNDTDTTMIVEGVGYSRFAADANSRKDIAIKTATGYIYRRITGAVQNIDGTETISIDSSFGIDITASSNPLISYMKFVRLAQDSVEVSYETNGVMHVATSFIDLLYN
jgi:hypothetical protein